MVAASYYSTGGDKQKLRKTIIQLITVVAQARATGISNPYKQVAIFQLWHTLRIGYSLHIMQIYMYVVARLNLTTFQC